MADLSSIEFDHTGKKLCDKPQKRTEMHKSRGDPGVDPSLNPSEEAASR